MFPHEQQGAGRNAVGTNDGLESLLGMLLCLILLLMLLCHTLIVCMV